MQDKANCLNHLTRNGKTNGCMLRKKVTHLSYQPEKSTFSRSFLPGVLFGFL